MKDFTTKHYDVIIIGGGITGAGTARDCAMRGMKVLLVEKDDLTNGATGRNHGLLHSGARYAVTDQSSATECIKENMILRKVARHCVEETDGLFITLPEDDLAYQATFVEACQKAGINAEIIDPEEARHIEPAVNPDLIGAVRIPDASIDPFRLTAANILDARNHGADILTYHEVTNLIVKQDKVVGVTLRNNLTGDVYDIHSSLTINAAGIWGHLVAKRAGITVNMFPAKGTLLIFGHRVNNMVINRCRKPANADILVPDDTVCVIGTTSDRVPFDTIDNLKVTNAEVDLLIREGEKLAPSLATTRVLRAYAGVRPLVAADNDPSGRNISRGIVCLDHASRDGMEGFITITGGKMMTYRLMAEEATNLACKKLNINKPCQTATIPLPGSEEIIKDSHGKRYSTSINAAEGRHGQFAKDLKLDTVEDSALICECEEVSVAEAKFAIEKLHVHNLLNLRRRTRVGMGTCQGELCTCRAANFICGNNVKKSEEDLLEFINERWKGMRPVAWGQSLSEAQLSAHIYQDLCGLDKLKASLEEK
ncbi:anaerobic glycerol-3-phosphate dehydrogenase subunit A [Prevotella amnii]|jgi:glycerol-3-phosphate dehydrogenase, anaerobic, A subunit|uniref:Glycerol-3-phosphate dehydrogenase n=2 Tax=Prevotella amnii TaxID=419005 RepID=A0A096B0A8_9BACT|nr:anaerobic glycerol-3-phosphate dehydrogenase subunit A [Prevotella amnii]EFN90713.1 glycerol-3-phosphate dehydrogenase, anaerobic, A subunit [Prevotella amnii CRIS 21A-A]KGF52535.1 glycerol-3-phosphate dehydrogenase [Prevotella amnii DNF00058]